MCTNQRLIYTKYSNRPMYIKCGHCPACLQEKAAKRVKRIHDNTTDNLVVLMVALTYSRGTAPFILRSDAELFAEGKLDTLNVYRECTIRKVRKPSNYDDYNQVYKRVNKRVLLDSIDFDVSCSLDKTKDLAFEEGKIGVCFYKDVQRFLARLRLNLKRVYKYEGKISVYVCSELGSKSLRPHFHLLIFIEKSAEALLRNAVISSWPFSNLARFPRAIERCYRAASYVASYVNQSSKFPLFFKHYFKLQHSYSKGFGFNNKKYSLDYILEKFSKGSLKYSVARSEKGIIRITDVLFPSYVINRYFPKFKGYTTCPPITLLSYMLRICRGDWQTLVLDSQNFIPENVYCLQHDNVYLSHEDLHKIQIRLLNAFTRFKENAPDGSDLTLIGYLQLHIAIWRCYNSTVLRLHLENPDVPLWEKYDNLDELNCKPRMRAVLGLFDVHFDVTNPNEFESNKIVSARFTESYYEHIKHRNVANSIYALSADCEL